MESVFAVAVFVPLVIYLIHAYRKIVKELKE